MPCAITCSHWDGVLLLFRQSMVALSPHVANYAAEVVGWSVQWLLPIAPFDDMGAPCQSLACLNGFVIQVRAELNISP